MTSNHRRSQALALLLVGFLVSASASAGVNRWTTNGPWGGPVGSAARDPANPSLLYAGTEHGLYLSRNAGASWSLATPSREGVASIAVSVRFPGSVYAITFSRVLLRSTDSGRTWRQSTPFAEDGPTLLAVDVLGIVYCAGYSAIWRSTDGGETWSKQGQGLGDTPFFVSDLAVVGQAGLIYLATGQGIFRSGDLGVNWSRVSELAASDLDVDEAGVIYAADSDSGILSSADGLTWSALDGGTPPPSPRRVAAAPNGGTVWAIGGGGTRIFQWRETTGWLELIRLETFEVSSLLGVSDVAVLASSRQGLFRSTPNGGWEELNEGLHGQRVLRLALDSDQGLVYGAGGPYVFRNSVHSGNWTSFRTPDHADVVTVETMRTSRGVAIYAATSQRSLWKSFDAGQTWTRVEGIANSFLGLAVEPVDQRHAYLSTVDLCTIPPIPGCHEALVYVSADGGETWSSRAFRPFGPLLHPLSVDPMDPDTVYGWEQFLVRSGDGGRTWSQTSIVGPTAVLISPRNPSEVLVATYEGGLYRSFDRGMTWETAAAPPVPILALAEDPRDPEMLVAGTAGAGVFRSEDRGETWAEDNRGIETLDVYDLTFDSSGRVLYVATEAGVYTRESRPTRLVPAR